MTFYNVPDYYSFDKGRYIGWYQGDAVFQDNKICILYDRRTGITLKHGQPCLDEHWLREVCNQDGRISVGILYVEAPTLANTLNGLIKSPDALLQYVAAQQRSEEQMSENTEEKCEKALGNMYRQTLALAWAEFYKAAIPLAVTSDSPGQIAMFAKKIADEGIYNMRRLLEKE